MMSTKTFFDDNLIMKSSILDNSLLTLFGLGGGGGGLRGPPYYIFVYISFVSNQNKMKFGDFS